MESYLVPITQVKPMNKGHLFNKVSLKIKLEFYVVQLHLAWE